jgi:UDP-glucuronate decarboxylase
VDDMVEGMILFMNQEKQIGPLNLGSDFEIAIVDLANLIIRLTKSDSKIHFDPLPEDDPMQRRPDISAAEALINWRPKIDLETGLVDLVKDASSFGK